MRGVYCNQHLHHPDLPVGEGLSWKALGQRHLGETDTPTLEVLGEANKLVGLL